MIAQFETPSEGLSSSLIMPLLVVVLVYIVLRVGGQLLAGRGDPRGDLLLDVAFGAVLLAAGYVASLLVLALASEPGLMYDLASVALVVFVFFALLLGVLYAVFDVAVGGIARARSRRDGASAEDQGKQPGETGSSSSAQR